MTPSTSRSHSPLPCPADLGGLIKLNEGVALNHEDKTSRSVVVTATDPFLEPNKQANGRSVTVTIHVLDVPEIIGLASRIRVNENTKEIADTLSQRPEATIPTSP